LIYKKNIPQKGGFVNILFNLVTELPLFAFPFSGGEYPARDTHLVSELRRGGSAASREFRLTPVLCCRSISPMVPSRRDFIKKALAGVLFILGLGFLIPGLRIFSPVGNRHKELVYFPLILEEEVPRSGVKKIELTYAVSGKERKVRVFIVSTPNGLSVFSATCTHLGCLVNYNKEKHEFVCPCHGGRYDLNGKNIAGPPPAPLTRFPIQTQNGMVAVGIKV